MNQGILIAFEGIDGCGKSTLIARLYETLQDEGFSVLLTKEPGGTEFGKEIRAMVQHPGRKLVPISEFLLFAADRADHIERVIKPALAAGTVILCDRMADSSVVYQGYGRGLSLEMINQVNSWALAGIRPTATFYLKLDYATAHERILERSRQKYQELSAFDEATGSFFQRVIAGYKELYRERSDVYQIDASMTKDQCFEQAYSFIKKLIV
jgi:dTMP kinase